MRIFIRLLMIIGAISCFGIIADCQSLVNSSLPDYQFLKAGKILIIAPHPDDEILGFAGIIYDAVRKGKEVVVVIVTNGDGYGSACYFLKSGCPKEDSLCKGLPCTPEELENYGQIRISESREALKILGLDSARMIALGYPDGWMGDMLRYPDSIFKGNTSRHLSFTGKPFSGKSLKEELKALFQVQSDEEVYTTHIKDAHSDHSSLAGFIQQVRTQLVGDDILFPVFWSVIHEPSGNDNLWPNPSSDWESRKDSLMYRREARYTPWLVLQLPSGIDEQPGSYFLPEPLWADKDNRKSLMRQATDKFQTGVGVLKLEGPPVMKGYEGYLDRNGYLISFVKRNHLFWLAPFPDQKQ